VPHGPETPHGYQRFFAELKRRHVFRVAAVYGATAFVVVQAADLLQEALRLPPSFLTGVTVLALLGFPLALVLAWAYERTPEGVRKTGAATREEIDAIASAPAARRWPVGLAALAGAALLAVGAWWVLRPEPAEARSYDSIAVLPFVNMSGDPEDAYLGDGMAEELLNALTRIPGLAVASRTSSFALRESPLGAPAIGDSLNVETVVEGSVRRTPDRLRITVQLIDAATGYHVWSETYDRVPAELLDIQDDLTRQIVSAVAAQLGTDAEGDGAAAGRSGRPGQAAAATEDAEAYDLYLQGRYFWNKRTPDDMEVAIGLFERAIEADSGFAPAWAAIADARAVPTGWRNDPATALDEAERFARAALAIDPTLAQAHTALAYAVMMRDLDFPAAEASFRRALALDPGYATAHQWYAELLSATDRHDEAVREARRAESLDPTSIIRWNVARVLYFAGRYEEAIAQERELAPGDGPGDARDVWQFLSYERLGDADALVAALSETGDGAVPPETLAAMENASAAEARALLVRAMDAWLDGDATGLPAKRDLFWAARARAPVDPDGALVRLEELAEDPEDVNARVVWFEVLADPAFDRLRDDPRYGEANARFGL
jgi:adenylate cyclase